jgi:5-methylcytosine-specific restriction protein A
MPQRPMRPCTHPGCRELTRGGRCERHRRPSWEAEQKPTRLRGRRLQRERDRLFSEQPLCVQCQSRGITRVATQRDHIVPLAEGGEDTRDNTQALCDECHEFKSQAEALRGRGLAQRCSPAVNKDGMPTDSRHPWNNEG